MDTYQKECLKEPIKEHNGYGLYGMESTITRINTAISNKEKVLIYGDFDTDGIMSTTILLHMFRSLEVPVSYRIPHRITHSHGLHRAIINDIPDDIKLVITVDCGINDAVEVSYLKDKGIDCIITDHHISDINRYPTDAISVINPHQEQCTYPYKELCGAMIAYKIAYEIDVIHSLEDGVKPYLELATIATIADCMPLTGENRYVVQQGLKALKSSYWEVLRILLKDKEVDENSVSYTIAPLINSASRLSEARLAVRLFMDRREYLLSLLSTIDSLNSERKAYTEYGKSALESMNYEKNRHAIIDILDVHSGVVGLIASRAVDDYKVPVCIGTLNKDTDEVLMSCRCKPPYHIKNALDTAQSSYIHYGGHSGAGGFRCHKDDFDSIKQTLINAFDTQKDDDYDDTKERITLDASLITLHTAELLDAYKPYGIGFTKPLFTLHNARIADVIPLGSTGEHYKLAIEYDDIILEMIAFFASKTLINSDYNAPIDIQFDISYDVYNNTKRLKLYVRE